MHDKRLKFNESESTRHDDGFRLADRPADYKRLGIVPVEIAEFEDGQRIGTEKGHYEWWYFDAHLDNGATVVVVFFVAGLEWRYCMIALSVAALGVVFLVASKPYRLRRVVEYFDPSYKLVDRIDRKHDSRYARDAALVHSRDVVPQIIVIDTVDLPIDLVGTRSVQGTVPVG